MQALASNDPAKTRAGLSFAAPRSPAYRYLQYFALTAEAGVEGGHLPAPGITRPIAGGMSVCDAPSCSDGTGRFTRFTVDATGRVADFVIDGAAFASRLTVGGGVTVRNAGAWLTVLASYQAGAGENEHVVVGLRSGSRPLRLLTKTAVFREAGGIEDQTVFAVGRSRLGPHATGVMLWVFPTSAARGLLVVDACAARACTHGRWTLRLPVRPRTR